MTPFKICGLTRLEDALTAAQAGAWAVGFVIEPSSPRAIRPETISQICAALPAPLLKVGVVVNPSMSELHALSETSGLTHFQLHGEESPEFCRKASEQFKIIKAFRPRTEADLAQVFQYPELKTFLIDAFVEGVRGGTGQQTNPHWIAPLKSLGKIGLAGGIRPDNARALARSSQADFLDVSSGVEERPGIKSAEKIHLLSEQLRGEDQI